jgi:hypothetical protein
MIKGINKQIIEIRCTNDEYFDKVLLFVRADKAGMPYNVLQKGADNLCGRMIPAYGSGNSRKILRRNTLKIAALLILLAAVAAVMVIMICQAV